MSLICNFKGSRIEAIKARFPLHTPIYIFIRPYPLVYFGEGEISVVIMPLVQNTRVRHPPSPVHQDCSLGPNFIRIIFCAFALIMYKYKKMVYVQYLRKKQH